MIVAASVNVPSIIAVIIAILGGVGTIAAAVTVVRQQAIKASLATIIEANAELRKANDDLRTELAEERQERAKLEGKIEVFTTHFAQQILDVVIRTVEATNRNTAQQ
jgi:regulator of replication initiation timing